MFFSTISSPRRFKVIGDTMAGVLAIYDQGRAYTLYAPIGVDMANPDKEIFVGAPRAYFEDQLEEIF